MERVCNGTFFFCPAPWGPGEGLKGQILLNIIKFQLQSQFQKFLNQTLCVFSQMKDIKHIRRDFHSLAWVMPQGLDLGVPWGVERSKKIFFRNSTSFGVWVTYINGTCNSTIFLVPTPRGPWEGPKGQISLNLNHKVNFKDFLTKLCVSSHNWKIWNISDGIFIPSPGSCPRGGTWGYHGGLGGPKTFFPKFNQIWCVSYLHEWHMQQHNFLGLRLLGPWGGTKRSNIFKSQLQSQSQRFLI